MAKVAGFWIAEPERVTEGARDWERFCAVVGAARSVVRMSMRGGLDLGAMVIA